MKKYLILKCLYGLAYCECNTLNHNHSVLSAVYVNGSLALCVSFTTILNFPSELSADTFSQNYFNSLIQKAVLKTLLIFALKIQNENKCY